MYTGEIHDNVRLYSTVFIKIRLSSFFYKYPNWCTIICVSDFRWYTLIFPKFLIDILSFDIRNLTEGRVARFLLKLNVSVAEGELRYLPIKPPSITVGTRIYICHKIVRKRHRKIYNFGNTSEMEMLYFADTKSASRGH